MKCPQLHLLLSDHFVSIVGVVIGFMPATYTVVESVGTVDLMIVVFSGEFEKSVSVNLETYGHGSTGEIFGKSTDLYSSLCRQLDTDVVGNCFTSQDPQWTLCP